MISAKMASIGFLNINPLFLRGALGSSLIV